MNNLSEQKFNLYVFSVSFLLLFTAYVAIQNIETSIFAATCSNCAVPTVGPCQNTTSLSCSAAITTDCSVSCPVGTFECQSNVGSISLGALYLFFMIGSLGSSIVPNKIGTVPTIRLTMIGYCIYCLANILVSLDLALRWLILLPVSSFLGICAALLWAAQGAYLTECAVIYSRSTGQSTAHSIGEFNSIFWGLFQLCQVTGNLATSVILRTFHFSDMGLFVFFLFVSSLGTALMWWVQSIQQLQSKLGTQLMATYETTTLNVRESISQVLSLMLVPEMRSLIPLFVFNGLEQAFVWGDFTSHFVKESVGPDSIGYIMVVYGASNAFGSFLCGRYVDKCGPWRIFLAGAAVLVLTYSSLWSFQVTKCGAQWTALVLSASLLGIGDAVFSTLLAVVVGGTFKENPAPAFAVFKFFQTGALSASFFYNSYLGTDLKLTILLLCLSASLCFYGRSSRLTNF